jgi:putative ABC transport system permease protein
LEINTRWIKILKDLMGHKSRSLLVILSIAVGVGAVGMINNGKSKIESDLFGAYGAGNPTRVQIYVSPFDKDLVNAVRAMPEVETAEARRTSMATIYPPSGPSHDIALNVV